MLVRTVLCNLTNIENVLNNWCWYCPKTGCFWKFFLYRNISLCIVCLIVKMVGKERNKDKKILHLLNNAQLKRDPDQKISKRIAVSLEAKWTSVIENQVAMLFLKSRSNYNTTSLFWIYGKQLMAFQDIVVVQVYFHIFICCTWIKGRQQI